MRFRDDFVRPFFQGWELNFWRLIDRWTDWALVSPMKHLPSGTYSRLSSANDRVGS